MKKSISRLKYSLFIRTRFYCASTINTAYGLSVGGHIELDEDPNQAAIREVKEEVGLTIELYDTRLYHQETDGEKELIPPIFLNRHRINDTHEHVSHVYFGTAKTDQVLNQVAEASEEMHWFSRAELENTKLEISARVKFYAQTALEKLGQ